MFPGKLIWCVSTLDIQATTNCIYKRDIWIIMQTLNILSFNHNLSSINKNNDDDG